MLLAFSAPRTHCWLMFRLMPTSTPRFISKKHLSIQSAPSLYCCIGLFHPRHRSSYLLFLNFTRWPFSSDYIVGSPLIQSIPLQFLRIFQEIVLEALLKARWVTWHLLIHSLSFIYWASHLIIEGSQFGQVWFALENSELAVSSHLFFISCKWLLGRFAP